MIRITIDLPPGPNSHNEIAKIASAVLTSNARMTIANDLHIPSPVTGEHPVLNAIPTDSHQAPTIEQFAHAVENNDNGGGNGGRRPKG